VHGESLRRIRSASSSSRRGLLLIAALLSTLTAMSCGGCQQEGSRAPSSSSTTPKTAVPASSPETRSLPAEDDPFAKETLPPGVEFGPANPRLRQLAGEMDVKNRYASTVMLSQKASLERPDCSGILLAPRLVLTAGSCLCAVTPQHPSNGQNRSHADASSCAKRVFVTTVVYGEVGDPKLKELTTNMRFQTSAGSVRPHPELALNLNERGSIVGGRADLAVIILDTPLKVEGAGVLLASEEVKPGEFLVMAGYGHDAAVGGFYGARYFRQNRVVGTPDTQAGQFRYELQGVSAYNGFDGGPCFREAEEHPWLVGVASVRATGELECTSTTAYRDWLLEEIKHAESLQREPPTP